MSQRSDVPYDETKDDAAYGVYVVRDTHYVVSLYYHNNGVLYAACVMDASADRERRRLEREEWHFCDVRLLERHIHRTENDG